MVEGAASQATLVIRYLILTCVSTLQLSAEATIVGNIHYPLTVKFGRDGDYRIRLLE